METIKQGSNITVKLWDNKLYNLIVDSIELTNGKKYGIPVLECFITNDKKYVILSKENRLQSKIKS